MTLFAVADVAVFLSTPSARRATVVPLDVQPVYLLFLSTPSARRATRPASLCQTLNRISIHALREEGDLLPGCSRSAGRAFLSTPSARRATLFLLCLTHAGIVFLSTPSARRATTYVNGVLTDVKISIHALREEGDFNFSSTAPGRR